MDTPIVFPDPQLAVRNLLRVLLAERGITATVTTKPRSAKTESLPYVQIRSDGRYRDARLNGRATIRVLVYHRDEGLGEELAGLIEAILLAADSAQIRGFSPVMGPIPTGDPDTGEPLSFFTLTARLRPANLT